MATPRALAILPTYQERENLGLIVPRILHAVPGIELLVVDDASPDGTGELADEMAKADPRVAVLHRSGKNGLGAAYLAGFAWALERGYEVAIEIDADGSHPPERLPAMIAALSPHEESLSAHTSPVGLVIGSRWVPGGSVKGWPRRRELLSRGGNLYVRKALRMPVRDATAGFRAFRSDVLRSIDLDAISARGYLFQVEMTRAVLDAGYRIVEIPIAFVERELGESKMSADIIREAMLEVTRWGLRERAQRLRRR